MYIYIYTYIYTYMYIYICICVFDICMYIPYLYSAWLGHQYFARLLGTSKSAEFSQGVGFEYSKGAWAP